MPLRKVWVLAALAFFSIRIDSTLAETDAAPVAPSLEIADTPVVPVALKLDSTHSASAADVKALQSPAVYASKASPVAVLLLLIPALAYAWK